MTALFSRKSVIGLVVVLLMGLTAYYGAGAYAVRARPSVVEGLPDLPRGDLIHLASASGTILKGWKLDAEQPRAVVLLFHPHGANRRSMLTRAQFLVAAGYTAILFDFQAYGASWGEKATFGHRERHDVEAVIRYAKNRYSRRPLFAIGRSLGASAMLLAEMPLGVDAMVLESPYVSLTEAIGHRLSGLGLGPLGAWIAPIACSQISFQLDVDVETLRPIDNIRKVGAPLLLLGGSRDELAPKAGLDRLFDAANEPRQIQIFDGASHEDLHGFDTKRYEQVVLEFFAKYLS